MGIYMCMKSGCRVSGEDFAHSKNTIKASAFIEKFKEKNQPRGRSQSAGLNYD